MVDVHARLIRAPRAGRRAEPRARVPAHRRGDRRAQGGAPGAGRARAGGRDGVLQDPPLRAAARLRPARGPVPARTTSSATSRRRCPSATASGCGPPAAPRDHRHRRRQPARRPRRHDVLVPARARRPARRRRCSRAPTRSRARCSTCASFWAAVEALDNLVEPGRSSTMLIEGRRLVERATRWLVRANPDADRHRADDRAVRARREDAGGRAARRARGRGPGGVRRPRRPSCEQAGVPAAARRGGSPAMPSMLSVFDIVEVAAATERDQEDGDARLLPARLAARAQLAARPDHRAPAREPLAGAGAGGAARRPVQPAPGADARGARDRRGARRQRGARSTRGSERNGEALQRSLAMLADVKASRSYDTTTLPVALREIRSLLRGTTRAARRPGWAAGHDGGVGRRAEASQRR